MARSTIASLGAAPTSTDCRLRLYGARYREMEERPRTFWPVVSADWRSDASGDCVVRHAPRSIRWSRRPLGRIRRGREHTAGRDGARSDVHGPIALRLQLRQYDWSDRF